MTINENIRKLRAERSLTLEALGKAVGVSKQTIQRYENGQISTIPYDKIIALASALNVTPGYLMGWEEGKEALVISKDGELSPIYEDPQKKRLMAYCEKLSRLTPEHQNTVTTMIDFLASEEAKEKETKSQSSKEA